MNKIKIEPINLPNDFDLDEYRQGMVNAIALLWCIPIGRGRTTAESAIEAHHHTRKIFSEHLFTE